MIRNKGCPILKQDGKTHQYNFDEILDWDGAKVVWDDEFTGPEGTVKMPERALWTLIDSNGFIGFDSITRKDQEHKAKAAGAMFIYLFHHTELDTGTCEQLAQSWALRCIHNEKDWEQIDKEIAARRTKNGKIN